MAKVDIILATYNGEKYLEEQINSILSQTYADFQLIISDDCSTDDTVKIIKKIKDKRIKLYNQKENLGFNKNFEFLCSKATSEYVMIADQDDVWMKDKVAKMLKKIEEEEAALVYCDMKVVDANLNSIYSSFHEHTKKSKQCQKYNDFELLKIENVISGSSVIAKLEVVKKAMPFICNKAIIYDYWLSLIASQYGRICYLDETLQLYRQHESNSVGAGNNKKILEFNQYRNHVIDYKYLQYKTLYENKERFEKNSKQINYYFNVIKKIKENKKSISGIRRLYNTEKASRVISMIVLYNFPHLAEFLFKIKYKGAVKNEKN